MAAVISPGNWPKALRLGVRKYTRMSYDERSLQCRELFEMVDSNSAYEEWVAGQGFGLPQVVASGSPTPYDSHAQGYVTRGTPVNRRLGFVVTYDEVADNKYPRLMRSRAMALGKSFHDCEEMVAFSVLNNAFDSSYVGGDGKELCATDHPNTANGTFQNEPTNAVDFDQSAVESIVKLIWAAVDDRGLDANLRPERLIVSENDAFEATRLYESSLQSGTANNDVNALKLMNTFPQGVMVGHWLTDSDAFFVTTNLPNDEGLVYINRRPFETARDNEFDTENYMTRAVQRYAYLFVNPHKVYGSPGA